MILKQKCVWKNLLLLIFFEKSKNKKTCSVKKPLKKIDWCTTSNNPIQEQPSMVKHNPTNQQHLLKVAITIHPQEPPSSGTQPPNPTKTNWQTPKSHLHQGPDGKKPQLDAIITKTRLCRTPRQGLLGVDNWSQLYCAAIENTRKPPHGNH